MTMQSETKEPETNDAVSGRIDLLVITRRDYFAAAALQGLLANSYGDGTNQPLSTASQEEMATMARDQADHLINALAL